MCKISSLQGWKKSLLYVIIAVAAVVAVYLGVQAYQWFSVPSEVRKAAVEFYELRCNSQTDKALENVYFKAENRDHYYLMLETEEQIEDYKIHSIKRVNDDLYEIDATLNTSWFPEEEVTNYIMHKDNNWYFVINERDIDL